MSWRFRWFGEWCRRGDPHSPYPAPDSFVDEAWDSSERAKAIRYLGSGVSVAVIPETVQCLICDQQLDCVYVSDGAWVWPLSLLHYVENHYVRLPPEFVSHMKDRGMNFPTGIEPEVDSLEFPWDT